MLVVLSIATGIGMSLGAPTLLSDAPTAGTTIAGLNSAGASAFPTLGSGWPMTPFPLMIALSTRSRCC